LYSCAGEHRSKRTTRRDQATVRMPYLQARSVRVLDCRGGAVTAIFWSGEVNVEGARPSSEIECYSLFGLRLRSGPVFRDSLAAWLRWIWVSVTPPISPRLPA